MGERRLVEPLPADPEELVGYHKHWCNHCGNPASWRIGTNYVNLELCDDCCNELTFWLVGRKGVNRYIIVDHVTPILLLVGLLQLVVLVTILWRVW